MKRWLIFGVVSGLALGVWLANAATGLDAIDALGIGLGLGLISALALASMPWDATSRNEWWW